MTGYAGARALIGTTILFLFLAATEQVMPFRSAVPYRGSYLYNFVFVAVAGASYIASAGWRRPISTAISPREESLSPTKQVLLCILLSYLGLILIGVDRMWVNSVDFSKGLGAVRDQLFVIGRNREGFSSVFSVIGNILAPGSLFAVFLAASRRRSLRAASYFALFFVSLVSVMFFSYLNAGRSSVGLLVAMYTCLALIGSLKQEEPRGALIGPCRKLRSILFWCFAVTALTGYMAYIFSARAHHRAIPIASYAIKTITRLKGEVTPSFGSISNLPLPLAKVLIPLIMLAAYCLHGRWVFDFTLGEPPGPGYATLTSLNTILTKFGLPWIGEKTFVFQPLFLSTPGILFFDFGVAGLVAFAAAAGAALAIFDVRAGDLPASARGFAILALSSVLLCSPFLWLPSIQQFFPLLFFALCFFSARALTGIRREASDSRENVR